MANKNTKAIAQASKMSKVEASNAVAAVAKAPLSKLELFGQSLVAYVRAHADCIEKSEDGSFYLRKVDLGKGPQDYRLKIEQAEAKEGKRASHKRELYVLLADGKERLVQFGNFKKKYLYPLMGMVVSGKVTKGAGKMVVDPALTKKIAEAIRADRKAFTLADGVLTGKVADVGDIKFTETVKTLKNGKTQLERQLFINGELKLEGGQLGRIKNSFTKIGVHKTMADILADGNDAVSDLI